MVSHTVTRMNELVKKNRKHFSIELEKHQWNIFYVKYI